MENKIFIVANGGIGDVILFAAAIKKFRETRFPNAFIECRTSDRVYDLMINVPEFNAVQSGFTPSSAEEFLHSLKPELRPFAFSFDFPYRGKSKEINENRHIIDMGADILGVSLEPHERRGYVYIPDSSKKAADSILENINKPFICIAPFSRIREKDWGLDNFRHLEEQCLKNFQILQLGVSGNEILSQNVVPVFDKKLTVIAEIIRRAKYFIGLDTGLSHMSAAVQTPMSVIHIGHTIKRCGVLGNANILHAKDRNESNNQDFQEKVIVTVRTELESASR